LAAFTTRVTSGLSADAPAGDVRRFFLGAGLVCSTCDDLVTYTKNKCFTQFLTISPRFRVPLSSFFQDNFDDLHPTRSPSLPIPTPPAPPPSSTRWMLRAIPFSQSTPPRLTPRSQPPVRFSNIEFSSFLPGINAVGGNFPPAADSSVISGVITFTFNDDPGHNPDIHRPGRARTSQVSFPTATFLLSGLASTLPAPTPTTPPIFMRRWITSPWVPRPNRRAVSSFSGGLQRVHYGSAGATPD
jgi:hypothetical protein